MHFMPRRKQPDRPERTVQESIIHLFRSLYQIGRIAYDAAPLILLISLVIRLLQSIIPVASAYVFKLIFDRLGSVIDKSGVFTFEQDVMPLILLFGAIMIFSQTLVALDTYLNEEMGRRLEVHISQIIYRHLLTLKGMHYFESATFHDILQQATRLRWTPAQLIREASNFVGSLLTLFSFFGVVLVFSPLLASILIVATIPSFIVQMRFRQKRYENSWRNSPIERK